MGTYIFISYGHDAYGEKGARMIYEYLRKDDNNLLIWWDRKIKPATEWLQEIDTHLNELINHKPDSCFVYVATPYSASTDRDNFCINEIVKAVGGRVRVIPVKLVETPMPLLLCNKQWLDLSDISIDVSNQELIRRMDNLRKIIQAGQELPRDGKQEFLMARLEPCNFSLDLEKHLTNYVPRHWLLSLLKDWIEQSDSPLLLMLGGPGTGKTAFSIWMSYCELSQHVAAWHLCQYNDMRTCSLRNAVKSLAYYLASRIPAYYNMLDIAETDRLLLESDFDAGTLFKALILEKIQKISYEGSTLVILIDALDEASRNNYNELAEILAHYVNQLPKWLKIVVTSRNDASITSHLYDCAKIINLDDEYSARQSSDDVNRYVERMIGSENINVSRMVTAESGNNFLYAQLLCTSIKDNPNFSAGELPKGINSYYSNYMRRYFKNSEYDFEKHALPLLNLVMTAYEPLTKKDVFDRLHDTQSWCGRYSVFNGLVKCFGPLLKDSDGCLLPFHKSLSDWLVDNDGNQEFCVYRTDGLYDLIKWGKDVVAELFPDCDNRIVKHFYQYLPQYMIEFCDKSFFDLYTDLEFWKRRQEVIGVNHLLRLLIDELTLCRPNVRKRLYGMEEFFDVLNYFNIDLFNTGRYVHLHRLGYSIPLTAGMDDNRRLFVIRYLYINELYEEIDRHVRLFEEPYNNRMIESMLMNELGQTYRKLGQLERSAAYYAKSLDLARRYNGTYDEVIYTMLNLSRIRKLQCRDEEARQLLNEAKELYGTGLWRHSMQGSDFDFSAQQLARGVYYVTLENESFSTRPERDACLDALKWADDIYSDPNRRDRYYSNHLLSKIFYKIRTRNLIGIDDLIAECERSVSSKYDGIRFTVVKALWKLTQGRPHEAYEMALRELEYLRTIETHMIQRSELVAIVDYVSQQNHTPLLCDEFIPWYKHFTFLIQDINNSGTN